MGQRLRLFETNPGLMWLLVILGIACFIMLVLLLIFSLIYRPTGNPETLKYFSSDFLLKAARYNRFSLIISISVRILTWLLMAAAVWAGWKYFASINRIPIYIAAGYIALFYIILNIMVLPLSFYRGYTIEHQFGLSNQTVGMWFSDFAKSRGIDMVISVAAFTGIYALLVYIPKYWWLIAASVLAVFVVVGVYLYPVLIDPLFFKFKRLEDRVMREEILEVTDKAGIEVRDILVADASRRTVKANAYFTGFGNTRRIVLYDNLLNNFTRQEAINVVAHEAAHWRYAHIVKSISITIAGGFIGLFILNVLLTRSGMKGDFKSVFLIILLISLVTFLTLPVQNVVSRYFERQADGLTLEVTGAYDKQIELMTGLAKANLSNVDPHPVIKAVLYSHPPIMERIASAEMLKHHK
jgi:STE24 endopeptidase